MKKQIIATLVGGIILFLWQFLSWALIPIHSEVYGYTANQDKIMEALNQNLSEEGTYFLPNVAPGTSHEEAEAQMKAGMGKPWASVTWHRSANTNMAANMTRGFAIDLFAVFLLIWLLMQLQNLNVRTAVQVSVAIGIMAYLTIPYLSSIWFETKTLAHLIDAIVPWAIIGAWLGWYLKRS